MYFFIAKVDQDAVRVGIAHWEEHTCVRFQETSNTNQPHLRFIQRTGCWSYIGIISQTGQDVSLDIGCNSVSKKL